MRRFALPALLMATALGGCGWLGGETKTPLPGSRVAVMGAERKLEADPRAQEIPVTLPDAVDVAEWPQPQGTPGRSIGAVQVDGLRYAWRASVGSGNSRSGRVSGVPIVANGRIYAVDANSYLTVLDIRNGGRLWGFDPEPPADRSGGGHGGGVAVDGDRVYFATGYGQVIALESATGKEVWRYQMSAPARSGPAVSQGRVYAMAIDNTTHAIDANTGRRLWGHSGISESAGFTGAGSPVIDGQSVILGYSSGEIFALRAEGGREGNRHHRAPQEPGRQEKIVRREKPHELLRAAHGQEHDDRQEPPGRHRAAEAIGVGPGEQAERGSHGRRHHHPRCLRGVVHDGESPPKRRSREANARIASSRCASVKSGHRASVTQSSA